MNYQNINNIAFIGDLHFGVKNDNEVFLNHSLEFFENKFFPWLKENNIKTIFQFGDFMDKRKSVNIQTLNQVRERFIKYLQENDITLHILLGNHDVYYKTTNSVNSVEELFAQGQYDNLITYNKPTEVIFDNIKVLVIPWITEDNEKEIVDAINKTDAQYCLGHLELSGFEFAKGIMSHHGTETNIFSKFKHVYTGHYHTSSTKDNITYLGTPYEITWSDYNDSKFVYLFNTQNEELSKISLNERMFCYIDWDDDLSSEWLSTGKIDMKTRYNIAKGCSYKVVVTDEKWDTQVDSFVRWLDKTYTSNKIIVIDLYNNFDEDVDYDSIEKYNTIDLLYKAVSDLPRSNDLTEIVRQLYNEALLEQVTE